MLTRILYLVTMLSILAPWVIRAQSDPAAAFRHKSSPNAADAGKLIEQGGRVLLYGGENPEWNFDVTNFSLDTGKLLNGVGREYYPALIEPRFESVDDAAAWLADDSRVIVVRFGDEARAYPVSLMIRHEAVNDVVGGVPVLPVYCTRARMGAVFDRRMEGRTFTFGVSGYTYADPDIRGGMEVFILWDRDTESLWWPLLGEAVSGAMIGRPMQRIDIPHWTETTWGEARQKYPEITVLAPGQTQQPPEDWTRLKAEELQEKTKDN